MMVNRCSTLLIIFLSVLLSFTCASKPLQVGWELWYPYQYRNKQQQFVGLDFDVFNAILKQAKLTAEFTELPWKRHLLFIESGTMDIAMGASFDKDREKYAYFSLPYRKEQVRLYIRKKNQQKINISGLAQLINSNLLIGVETGYYYGKDYKKLIENHKFRAHINEVLDIEQNITMLLKGRIDGVLVDPVTMKSFITKYQLENEFIALPFLIYEAPIHLMLSKKSTDLTLLNTLNKAIKELTENGEIDKITARWTDTNKIYTP
jgi:polar amino acid transport system substrate-binding protein